MEIWPWLYHHRPDYPCGSRTRFQGVMAAALLHQHLDFCSLPFHPAPNSIYYFYFYRDACFRPSLKTPFLVCYSLVLDLILYLPHCIRIIQSAGVIGHVTYIVPLLLRSKLG